MRTNDGVFKIVKLDIGERIAFVKSDKGIAYNYPKREFLKFNHSENIIDLIKAGDYVNGKKVYFDKIENRLFVGNDYDNEQFVDKMKINSVVTAEQYKLVEYVF